MADDVRVIVHPDMIRALEGSPEMRRLILALAEPVALDAAAAAPKRTGAGAGSISAQAELLEGTWVADVSWDREHGYLRFQDYVRSRHGTATHFLELALDRHAHL